MTPARSRSADLDLVSGDDSALACDPRLEAAVATVAGITGTDEHTSSAREQMLAFCAAHPDALHRSCSEGHLSASALVVRPRRGLVLLHHHRRLDRWLQLGGHCDGDGNLAGVAHREAVEESGLTGLRLHGEPLDLDVHRVEPAGEPPHLHFDVGFLVIASEGEREQRSEESLALRWFTWDEAAAFLPEPRLRRMLDKARGLCR